jgi:hypothetical protein
MVKIINIPKKLNSNAMNLKKSWENEKKHAVLYDI